MDEEITLCLPLNKTQVMGLYYLLTSSEDYIEQELEFLDSQTKLPEEQRVEDFKDKQKLIDSIEFITSLAEISKSIREEAKELITEFENPVPKRRKIILPNGYPHIPEANRPDKGDSETTGTEHKD